MEKQKVFLYKKKKNLMYSNESLSFLNKGFAKSTLISFMFFFFVGYFASDLKTTLQVLGFIGLVDFGFLIHTIHIKKKYKHFAENGIKCTGTIKDVIQEVSTHWDRKHGSHTITSYYLVVEYINPYMGKVTQVKTESVTGDPFLKLSSLAVTVYVLENGHTLVTDFQQADKLTDSVKYITDPEFRRKIDSEKKPNFKFILLNSLFIIVIVSTAITKNPIILTIFVISIFVIGILVILFKTVFKKKK